MRWPQNAVVVLIISELCMWCPSGEAARECYDAKWKHFNFLAFLVKCIWPAMLRDTCTTSVFPGND